MRLLVKLAFAFGASAPCFAYVASTMWGWFVVPLGLPRIGGWQAYGLYCLAWVFRGMPPDDEQAPTWERQLSAVLFMWALLGIGRICLWGMS